ncbi:MAG: bile acid:sodium symporter [Candidatus Marinimicrobia bacterium]|nr:bile acid:sodium symporter [Candidatus Neomarinimicrobiota bacterium]|tara:strand:- start:6298 stop:7155 length:858 start_codon:yes stop_codon:yes gene_type:complete
MIIDIFLPVSLMFIMFTLGIGLTVENFKNIITQPKALILGLVNQMLLLPLVAFFILLIIKLPSEMAVGMMILACCPGGVTSNMLTKLAKGDTALSISFTAIVSIISVITLPIIVSFSMQYFLGSNAPSINILSLGMTMFCITTIPVGIGLFINTKYHDFSVSLSIIANKISTILFVIIIAGALTSEWEAFINNLNLLGPAIIALIFLMLFIGYSSASLFNLNKEKSITIAIESGIQNATVGITIGNLIFNQDTGLSILSLPSGVYGILMYLVCLPVVFLILRNIK